MSSDEQLELVRLALEERGWLVSRKDAIRFGCDFLLYDDKSTHSLVAVYVKGDAPFSLLEAKRFSRLCESVQKRAIVAEVLPAGSVKFVEIKRWSFFTR